MSAIQHIDRDRLYTDIVYRFQYVASFIGFGAADQKAIHDSVSHVAPLVPVVVDAVYDKLFSYDITKASFAHRMEGFSGKSVEDTDALTLKADQIKFRKEHLAKYLVKIVTGEYNEAMIKYLDWVALIHTDNNSKTSSINVELIHINALMGFVEHVLLGAISDLPLDAATKKATLIAYSKLLWVQNDFFIHYYAADGLELANASANVKGVHHKTSAAARAFGAAGASEAKSFAAGLLIGGGLAAIAAKALSHMF
ncbi:Protoglobin-domain-containing protein [Blastocladiella britannica]|nr:Protoglobin-domain-containing protein [Blastocladiella britannica]